MAAYQYKVTNRAVHDPATYFDYQDANSAVLSRVGAHFSPSAQDAPDMTVRVAPGSMFVGGALIEQNAQSTGTITAPASNPRIDLVHIDASTGVVGVTTGTEAASPSTPNVPSGKLPVAFVEMQTTSTAITDSMITDARAAIATPIASHNDLSSRDAADAHPQSAVTGLVDALAGKASTSHTHTISDVTDYEGGASEQQAQQINFNTLVGFLNMELASSDLPHGRIWTFQTDELSVKTGATYNASGDYYYNPGDPVLIDRTSGTAIGNLTGGGGLAAAFDGNTDQAWAACANISSAVLGYIGKDYGSGITKQVVKATVYSSNNFGLYQGDAGGAYTLTLQGSNNNSDWTDLGTASGNDSDSAYSKDITVSSPSGYRYYRVKLSTNAGWWPGVAEVQFFEAGTPANMTLIPSAVTADVQPTDIDVYFVHKAIDTVTMGTDCKLAASRDGGTTWVGLGDAESAYTEVASLPDGSKIWKKSHDMTSAETGSVVTMGLVTDNNKEQELHAFLIIWGG